MKNRTPVNRQRQADLEGNTSTAIAQRMEELKEELKQAGPEWDGPRSTTPEPSLIDRMAAWLAENWHENLGTPEVCPTAEGGVSMSWNHRGMKHSIDVSPDGASLEWCRYDPRTMQTVETGLPMDQQGWNAIQASLQASAT